MSLFDFLIIGAVCDAMHNRPKKPKEPITASDRQIVGTVVVVGVITIALIVWVWCVI